MDGRYYNHHFYYGYDELEDMLVDAVGRSEYNRRVNKLLSYGDLEEVPEFNLNSSQAVLDTISARRCRTTRATKNRHHAGTA